MNPHSPDDAVLVDKLRDTRDLDAFAALYDRHGGHVYGLAWRIVGNAAAAEDVVQDVFELLWTQPERYDARRGRFRSWLLQVAHNRAIDAAKMARRRAHSELNTGEHPIVGDTADAALGNLEAQRVRAAWERLPHHQREALRLAFWAGYSRAEIAELTRSPVGTVKWRIHDAVKRLGAELGITTEHRRPRYG